MIFKKKFFVYYIILSEHHHEIQLQNLSISDTLACATCQIQFVDRAEQVLYIYIHQNSFYFTLI